MMPLAQTYYLQKLDLLHIDHTFFYQLQYGTSLRKFLKVLPKMNGDCTSPDTNLANRIISI